MDYVFVYGTLLRGMDNFHLIEPHAAGIAAGETAGELYHLEYGYPALVLGGGGRVRGEAVRVADMTAALPVLDHLEGYRGPGDADNLYDRVVCRVRLDSGATVDAFTYVWAHPAELGAIGTQVPAGCWRDFLAARPDDVLDRYYFAYGSCMDHAGVVAAAGFGGDFAPVGAARLYGWRFALNKRAAGGRHATANIVPAQGATVYGVLYRITGRAERVFLNRREGYPHEYFKEYLDVRVGETVYRSSIVYAARPEYVADGLPPRREYKEALLRGAAGLPAEYRAMLAAALGE